MTHSFPTRRSSDLGRTDHMNVDLETMAGEVAGNIRAGSGAVAFGSGFRIHADDVDDGARICDIDEIPGGAARFTRCILAPNGAFHADRTIVGEGKNV